MNSFMFDGSEGRNHLQQLIDEAQQERFAQSVAKQQGNQWSLSQIRPALRKALESIRR